MLGSAEPGARAADQVAPAAPLTNADVVQAVPVLSTKGLTIKEFFGASSSGDTQLSACLATVSQPSGEAFQTPEFDQYVMVISGQVQLLRGAEKLVVAQGQGVVLKAGEQVRWLWAEPCQYAIISVAMDGAADGDLDGDILDMAAAMSGEPVEPGGLSVPPRPTEVAEAWFIPLDEKQDLVRDTRPGELAPLSATATEEADRTEVTSETEGTGAGTATPPNQNLPEYISVGGLAGLARGSSLSAFDQLLDTEGLMQLRAKMEDQAEERPVRYGARHLSTPIVVVSSELNPWSKTGGLAMVAASYGYEFAVRGHRTMAISPRYGDYKDCTYVGSTQVWLDGCLHQVGYYHQRQEYGGGQGCDYVFVEHPCYKRPAGLYGDPAHGGEYEDNVFRFALLCLAAAEAPLILNLGGSIYGQDVMFIANDWQTGLLPVYLLYKYKRNNTYMNARSIMVIHNLGYQGKYRMHKYPTDRFLGLPHEATSELQGEDLNYGLDCINLLSVGVKLCDRVLTVSPNYATEIQSPEGGHGMHDTLRDKASMLRMSGILNGISDEWSPATDPNVPRNYTAHTFEEGKRQCKAALQQELGLNQDPNVALIGFCGRLCYQKGVHLITEILPWLMHDQGNGVNGRVQLILMGKGDPLYEGQLRAAEATYRGRLCGYVGFDPTVEHRMMAGCDLLLMPSQYEPCGLPQMYAQQYATLPVVHETGGLKDSVRGLWDEARDRDTATGFLFSGFDTNHLKERLYQALDVFHHKKALFRQMQVNAISSNYYWPQAIDEYEKHIDYTMEDPPFRSW